MARQKADYYPVTSTNLAPAIPKKHSGRPKKVTRAAQVEESSVVSALSEVGYKVDYNPANGNGLMHVQDLRRLESSAVEVDFRGHTLYLRAPSIAFRKALDGLALKAQTATDEELNRLILDSVSQMARYLGNNLFNDKDCQKPVGTAEEFEEIFSPAEMQDLFQQINTGVKKKVTQSKTTPA